MYQTAVGKDTIGGQKKQEMKENNDWKVTTNFINGKCFYAVYRKIRNDEVDHSGNREYATGWLNDKAEAEARLKELQENK